MADAFSSDRVKIQAALRVYQEHGGANSDMPEHQGHAMAEILKTPSPAPTTNDYWALTDVLLDAMPSLAASDRLVLARAIVAAGRLR